MRRFSRFGMVLCACGTLLSASCMRHVPDSSETYDPGEKEKQRTRIADETQGSATAATVRIELGHNDAGEATVDVVGLNSEILAAWDQLDATKARPLAIYIASADVGVPTDVPAMAGRCLVAGDRLRFQPDFPLSPELEYIAVYTASENDLASASPAKPLVAKLRLAEKADSRPSEPTRVIAICPSGEVLPENLLRLYIHFSAPMSRGGVYRHIHLLDEQGERVVLPFLEISEELWDPEQTRLTLLFDPGRIKRGLVPHEQFGPPLVAGRKYRLVIDANLPDAQSKPLAESFDKKFSTGPSDTRQPNIERWKIGTPKAGTEDALQITFDEPLDRYQAERLVWIENDKQQRVPGEVTVGEGELRWSFAPQSAWAAGTYRLVADNVLEDRAGNSLGRPFEVDLNESPPKTLQSETMTREFLVE